MKRVFNRRHGRSFLGGTSGRMRTRRLIVTVVTQTAGSETNFIHF
ncbi:hypothetical protein RISK_003260 [Rhodopirellula islandica]|uniref:Uncharacterized protein n=1 Tax=Rhodopirellula islandica TaxID=595434 RepID=A0A0J1BDE4_RHOIS|nr:hypothetical protein RISK_003260 [Rhodopirellula islandica]